MDSLRNSQRREPSAPTVDRVIVPIAADGGAEVTVGQSLADFLHRERVPAGLIDRLDYIVSPGRRFVAPSTRLLRAPRHRHCEGLGDN